MLKLKSERIAKKGIKRPRVFPIYSARFGRPCSFDNAYFVPVSSLTGRGASIFSCMRSAARQRRVS